jgi:hypothetical protein
VSDFDWRHPDEWSFIISDTQGNAISMMGKAHAETKPLSISAERESDPLFGRGLRERPKQNRVERLVIDVPFPEWRVYPQSSDRPTIDVKLTAAQLTSFSECQNPRGPNRCRECIGCELNDQVNS